MKLFVFQVVADFDRTLSKYAHEGQVCSTTHGKGVLSFFVCWNLLFLLFLHHVFKKFFWSIIKRQCALSKKRMACFVLDSKCDLAFSECGSVEN